MEDLEADEFAARLLMPQKLLSSFNYYSIPVIAAWLNVSNSALVYRLNRLNRVDLITTRKVKLHPPKRFFFHLCPLLKQPLIEKHGFASIIR